MTPQRWQQVKSVLADALERAPNGERTAFLHRACAGDDALRQEVVSLLAQQGIVELEPYDEENDDTAPSADAGRRVGAYELIQELGRGGMGAVWLARRADGRFDQQVAIKLLKRGTDTEEVLRRFRAERQILARLEHPGIARLLDGGETDDGLPFFVLEYVENGMPITGFIRQHGLTISERLQLFRKVCAAVQFAHQRLVVHRDLKPGNILVTPEGEPKLLDFGIAKLLDTDNALEITAAERQRLTPAYASPEQVRGEPVTTVSDVYALGALLYEGLTGQPPHRFASAHPPPAELLRVISETEPLRPSLAVADPGLRRRLRGDLDNIVRRALAREPARRYPSASALAEDLRRHLENRPVRARPDTLGYRTAKFIERNKVAVAVGALVTLALLGAGATALWQARRAERRFGEVRHLTNSFLFEIHDAIRDLPGSTAARQLVVSRALEYLDRLANEAAGDRALQLELAAAYLKVGDVQGKPYTPNLGDSSGALRSYQKAAEIAAPLAQGEHGEVTAARDLLSQAQDSLGSVLARLNRLAEATASHRRALALRQELLRSDPAHADDWRRGSITSLLGLGDTVMAGNHLEETLDRYRAALAHYREALPLCENLVAAHPQNAADLRRLTQTCSRLGAMLTEIARRTGDAAIWQEAFAFHRRTLALNEAALRAEPGSVPTQRRLADELAMTAYARMLAGENLADAAAQCRRAVEILDSLAAHDPNNLEARQDLSHAYYLLGRVQQAQGDLPAAAKSYRRCLSILELLVAAHPENVETAADLARVRASLDEVGSESAATAGAEN